MIAPGEKISHFEILEKLGEGGMGAVYKARDLRLDRLVAIKVLSADAVSNQERQLRFIQEAKSASALNHPNIVTVYEIDTTGDVAFIAMEYIDGRTLDHLIPQKGLRIGEALHYAVQAADALAAAHAAGIIHRDIKPANIIVNGNGVVKVLDFGLAKLSERGVSKAASSAGESQPTLTLQAPQSEEGSIMGTIAYMSPEQAEAKKIDARSDIFSFGIVLYEMITGRRAFMGDTKLSTMAAILNQEPKPASGIVENLPPELDRVLARCLRKAPARRFQTMADLKVALEELKEETDSGKLTPAAAALVRRRRTPVLVAISAVVLLAAGGVTWRVLRPAAKAEVLVKLLPLTTYPGSEFFPTFSPDGSQVAFNWNGEKQDHYDIYVKLVDGGAPLRLTHRAQSAIAPAWAPNGRHIAFQQRDGIYLISPLGGPERKICDLTSSARGLSWSPDSKSLAVADRVATTDPYRIFLVSVDTGEKRSLTEPAHESYGDLHPAFSPDGRTLVFGRSRVQGVADLMLVPAGGGNPTRLISDTRDVVAVAWTPDGRDLIFSSNRSGAWALWRIPANAQQGTEPKPVPGVNGEPGELAISRAGADGLFRLVYSSYSADADVWRCDLPQADHETRLIASTRTESSAKYSPDGTRIAFASDRSGYFEIWVCDADGSNPVQLTTMGTFAGMPTWSPDGQRIAFDSLNGGNRDVYVIAAQGGSLRRMTTEPSEESRPSFSHDGRWIYFMSDRSGSRQIWKMPSQGGPAVQLTTQGGLEPRESPDGKVVYYAKERNAPGLRSVPVDGGEETTVLESAWLGSWGMFSGGIYFLDFPPGPHATSASLKFYDFQTRRVTETGKLEAQRSSAGLISVSADGRYGLFFRYNRRDSDLFLLENFR